MRRNDVNFAAAALAKVVVESKTMDTFSGIPVRKLLENDASVAQLDLGSSGCGVVEAAVLGEVLKVGCVAPFRPSAVTWSIHSSLCPPR